MNQNYNVACWIVWYLADKSEESLFPFLRLLLYNVIALKIDLFLNRCSARHTGDSNIPLTEPVHAHWEEADHLEKGPSVAPCCFYPAHNPLFHAAQRLPQKPPLRKNLWSTPRTTSLVVDFYLKAKPIFHFFFFFSEWKMHTLGCGRNCERWDPEIRVDGRHRITGQNCDTDRSKYDENEENDDQRKILHKYWDAL